MNMLDGFAFEIRNVRSGELSYALSDADVARMTGVDVVEIGSMLEFAPVVSVGPIGALQPQFVFTRVPLAGRA
jgi:hypothetical protein